MTEATQTRHPWRATVRTLFAFLVGAATLLPVLAAAGGVDALPGVAQAVTVATVVTRILAMPAVDAFLRQYVPWLAAAPADQPAYPF